MVWDILTTFAAECGLHAYRGGIHFTPVTWRVVRQVFPSYTVVVMETFVYQIVTKSGKGGKYACTFSMPTQKQEKRWYIFRLPKSNNKARAELYAEDCRRRRALLPQLEYFAPVFMDVDAAGGKSRLVEKPLYLNYVFIRFTVAEICDFRRAYPHYNPIRRTKASAYGDFLYVADREMRMMQMISSALAGTMPCLPPCRAAMSKGDRVRIMGGPFSGVEGVLLTQKGKDGGCVVIDVCSRFTVSTLTIRPEYIKVISFAKEGKHLYKKLDSYYPRIRRAMRASLAPQGVSEADLHCVEAFITRFGGVSIPSDKIRCKYLAFMMMSCAVTGDAARRDYYAYECSAALPAVTNQVTRAFILASMYAATRNPKYRSAAESVIALWDKSKLTPKQRDVISDLEAYGMAKNT